MPDTLDALIVPEDTYRILQAVTEELDPNTTPLDLWASVEKAARTEKYSLGSVMIVDGKERGVKFLATVVVYDFDAETICCREAVYAGLYAALAECAKRDCQAVGVFPLGTLRGGIYQEEYLAAVNTAVASLGAKVPRTLYLLLPDAVAPRDLDG
jgi:hypothetical protein